LVNFYEVRSKDLIKDFTDKVSKKLIEIINSQEKSVRSKPIIKNQINSVWDQNYQVKLEQGLEFVFEPIRT
jgi:hypothetical protein